MQLREGCSRHARLRSAARGWGPAPPTGANLAGGAPTDQPMAPRPEQAARPGTRPSRANSGATRGPCRCIGGHPTPPFRALTACAPSGCRLPPFPRGASSSAGTGTGLGRPPHVVCVVEDALRDRDPSAPTGEPRVNRPAVSGQTASCRPSCPVRALLLQGRCS